MQLDAKRIPELLLAEIYTLIDADPSAFDYLCKRAALACGAAAAGHSGETRAYSRTGTNICNNTSIR